MSNLSKLSKFCQKAIESSLIPGNDDNFEKEDKKIRKLSNIGYRLLNFISYSHLFYSFCMGNLEKDKLNEYLIKNCNILDIIDRDWNLLKKALKTIDFLNGQYT